MGKKRCSHKKLIGQKLMWVGIFAGMPQNCILCNKTFIPEIPRAIKTVSSSNVYICSQCLAQLKCHKCAKALDGDNIYVAECMHCGKVVFLCQHCSEKRLFINLSQQTDPQELITKLYSIIEELINMEAGKHKKFNLFNLFKRKRKLDSKQLFPFIMNINMYFNEELDSDFYDDGFENEDWWSN